MVDEYMNMDWERVEILMNTELKIQLQPSHNEPILKLMVGRVKLKKLREGKIVKIANEVYCYEMFLLNTLNERLRDGNGCMGLSRHIEISSWLPRLGNWVPGEDRGEFVVVVTLATGDVEDISDGGGSQSVPW